MVYLIIQIFIVSNRIGYVKFCLYFQTLKLPKCVVSLKLKVKRIKFAKFQTFKYPNFKTFRADWILETLVKISKFQTSKY